MAARPRPPEGAAAGRWTKDAWVPEAWVPFAGLTLDTAAAAAPSPASSPGAAPRTSPGSDASDQQLNFQINLARVNAQANRRAAKKRAEGSKQSDADIGRNRSQRYILFPCLAPAERAARGACLRGSAYATNRLTKYGFASGRCVAFVDEATGRERRLMNPALNKVHARLLLWQRTIVS